MRRRLHHATRLVLASHNAGKLREIADLLRPYQIEVVNAGALGLPEPEETAATFVGNAELKARAAATASGLVALSDDSGLCVAGLQGAPGIYSARWAGPDKDFAAAMARVEKELERSGAFSDMQEPVITPTPNPSPQGGGECGAEFGVKPLPLMGRGWGGVAANIKPRAHFVCALSLCWPDGHCESFQGEVHGQLIFPPRGARGFGYDPIFMADGYDITFGEMDPDAKHAISHRARAFKQMTDACFTR